MDNETLYTTGQIADLLQEPPQRVGYIIGKYRLKPRKRVGIIRLFDGGQVAAIRRELRGIQIRGAKNEL